MPPEWVDTDVFLHDTLFANESLEADETVGTGIFDVFDRYNFTVNGRLPLVGTLVNSAALVVRTTGGAGPRLSFARVLDWNNVAPWAKMGRGIPCK